MGEIPPGDSNLLWVRSRGLCAHPDCSSALVELDGDRWITLGERAHIRSERPDGPRHDPGYGDPNRYENLVLLCRRHHKLIDTQPDRYPVAVLDDWKHAHEVPVASTLGLIVGPPPEGSRYRRRANLFESVSESVRRNGTVAVTGISGIGKTQLAGDYFRSGAHQYTLRAWIRAADPSVLYEDFSLLGSYVGVGRHDDESLQSYCGRVREALSEHTGWLLVFDGAPDEATVADVLPAGPGHVLITSQSQDWIRATMCGLPDLARNEAIAILDRDEAFAGLPEDVKVQASEAAGGVPLCLVQLMGYRSTTGMSAQEAVALFGERRGELLARGAPSDHPSAQAALGEVLAALTTSARQLLGGLSYLASDPLPVPTESPLDGMDVGLGSVFTSRVHMEDAVAELRTFSLVERDGGLLSVHSLVQELVRGQQTDAEAGLAKMAAIALVASVLPERVDREDVAQAGVILLPHLRALVEHVARLPGTGVFLASILNRLAPVHGHVGDRSSERRDLELALRLLDDDDPILRASILTNLANSHADVGQFDAAISLTTEALGLKRAHGAEPESVAITLGVYGVHLEAVGRHAEALEAHVQAAQLLRPEAGRRLADAEVDQARVLSALGRYDESLEAASRALAHSRADPAAWTERSSAHLAIALVHEQRGDLIAALASSESAVAAASEFKEPSTALAKALGSRGRYRGVLGATPEGVADLRDAVELFGAVEGRTVDYARALGNLGLALVRLGMEAEQQTVAGEGLALLRESLDVIAGLLPEDHPTRDKAETMLRQMQQVVLGTQPPGIQ